MLHDGITAQQQELDSNHYLYNGKEAQACKFGDYYTNTNWLDYGARFYDAALGRFLGVDPIGGEILSFVTI